MKFPVKRIGNSLWPDGTEANAEFEKLPQDKEMMAEVTQPRSGPFHRLFFKLCQRIGAGIGKDTAWVMDAFKTATGHYDIFRYGGKEHLVLRSIAFHKMDGIAFKQFFERCVQVAYEEWRIDPASVADLLAKEEAHVRK